MQTLVLFAHGKESGPWGSKIQHLAAIAERLGAQVVSPDYGDLPDPDARVARLRAMPLPAHERLVRWAPAWAAMCPPWPRRAWGRRGCS